MKTRKDREEGLKNRRWGSSKVNFYFGFHQGYYQEFWGLMHGLDPSMHSTPPLPSAFLCFILLLWRLLSLLLCVSVTSTAQSSQDFHLRKVQIYSVQFSPVAQSCLTLCDPMDCSTPGLFVLHHLLVCSNSCLLSRWYHPTISSSVVPFSSRLQSFPASGSFPMSQFLESSGQSIGVSALASVLPMNIQDWSPLGWTGWISLQSKGLSRVFSNTTVQKASILQRPTFFMVQLPHPFKND